MLSLDLSQLSIHCKLKLHIPLDFIQTERLMDMTGYFLRDIPGTDIFHIMLSDPMIYSIPYSLHLLIPHHLKQCNPYTKQRDKMRFIQYEIKLHTFCIFVCSILSNICFIFQQFIPHLLRFTYFPHVSDNHSFTSN